MDALAQPRAPVLIVDDKRNMLRLMAKVLHADAHIFSAERGLDAIRILEQEPIDVVLCDVRMPDVDGLQVLQASKRLRPRSRFILMTAYASVTSAVEALRLGAYDYLTKPLDPEAARRVVLRALGQAPQDACINDLQASQEVLPGVIASSTCMHELGALVRRIAASDATVVLLGETGAGKERLARAIHGLSARTSGRFVAINCAAIPAELLESELFGYRRGAFSGAHRDHRGLFEDAHQGTLFFDEIGEMSPALQAKLTRVLEERAVRRLGESGERRVDVRIVAATHRDLEGMVRAGKFRQDLWYRLNVATIHIPPLRERTEDVEPLALRFLHERSSAAASLPLTGFSESALSALKTYHWPGNVRQLRAAVERASIVASGTRIEIGDLPPEVSSCASRGNASRVADVRNDVTALTWEQALEAGRQGVARRYLEDVLNKYHGRVSEAAAHAGVERQSFYRLLRKFAVALDRPLHGAAIDHSE